MTAKLLANIYGIHKIIMEKNRPHYKLSEVQAVVAERGVQVLTQTALMNAARMGLSAEDVCALVAGMTRAMFFKSMTTHADHRVWQDVYHVPCPPAGLAYVKVTLQPGAVVIQFKEK